MQKVVLVFNLIKYQTCVFKLERIFQKNSFFAEFAFTFITITFLFILIVFYIFIFS